jgi:hypothetical protein
MTPRQLQRWAATRARGRSRFIWLFGVLGWGIPMVILWTAFMVRGFGLPSIPVIPFAAIAFPLGGYVWGAAMWWMAEAAFQKAVANQQVE